MTNHKTGTRDQPSRRYGSAGERLELLEAEKKRSRWSRLSGLLCEIDALGQYHCGKS
jgi:hypothetical protein